MSVFAAVASEPSGAGNARSRSLLVCTGAFALSLFGAAVLLLDGAPVVAVGVMCLTGAVSAALWAHRRVRETEARLRTAVEEGEALDRANSDLRRFALAVAHDLRAPLVSTKGMLTMAKDVASSGELQDVIQLLDRAANTAQRMDGVISGILDLAMAEESGSGASDLVDLDEILTNSLEDLHPALQAMSFDVRRDESLGLVQGDARYIQQVFDNLVGNAVKYVRPQTPGQPPVLAVRATRLRRSVRISVADNGTGIPRSEREGVLSGTPSQARAIAGRASSKLRPVSGANLGLGLPLAKLAMEKCGGTLSIQTSSMGGTEFVLDFEADPCVIPDEIPATLPKSLPGAVLADHPSYSSRTILTTG